MFCSHRNRPWVSGRRKNSKLNKRRPPARKTHSACCHARTWYHARIRIRIQACTHIVWSLQIEQCMLTLNSFKPMSSHITQISQLLCLMCTQGIFFFTFNLSVSDFDKCDLFAAVVRCISVSSFLSSCCTYRISWNLQCLSCLQRNNHFQSVDVTLIARTVSDEEQSNERLYNSLAVTLFLPQSSTERGKDHIYVTGFISFTPISFFLACL